ncbi:MULTISPECIES: DUF6716 putative glycosyltransferase [Streptomyces]|jgi:hypothetical protein|uniref:Uncharacterized protein n=2 Tax=Streptomyces TaxID=1883 RepID=A0A514JLZ7_9ACTN|nr:MULTISPECIES: DUF6716 putative glycosyltransferase [Streptomyces]MBA8942517.1 hypothetical protein [Streptomyces calvus]MBA8975519.1 hypothetical protein [Streptomyces calvus]MYS26844.1 hypothetical protein [Streptomyces sp. SID7804]QDI68360.1 hypothetical protein CD934_06480 [Streptomyces calvus]GGP68887.1 hypothetical protein GCM10010247_47290 [Streptomyces calvus]
MRIHVLADSDTRWKWGGELAQRLHPAPRVHAHMLNGRATPTARQMAEVGIRPETVTQSSVAEFVTSPALGQADVLVVGSVGGTTQAILHGLARVFEHAPRRPVLVTGYVGVVYENLTDGLLLRAGADVVLANSPFDARRFREIYHGLGIDDDCVVQTALPFLAEQQYDPLRTGATHPFTVTFAVQPSVPEDRDGRVYILRRAIQHARLRPGREVLIKLRSKPGEQTTHIEPYHYETLAEQLGEPLPPNLQFVYGNMAEVLDRTDLLVTVSSTAALESMHRGIPTVILSDLGVREPHGNHYFTGSGCIASWNEIDEGCQPYAHEGWLEEQGILAQDPYAQLRRRVTSLSRAALPPIRPYYTMQNAAGYLPRLLARRGLAPDGTPLPHAANSAGQRPGLMARTSRKALRRAYRFGVQTVAPKIQRWGGL